MPEIGKLLFVYGTLLSAATTVTGRSQRARLSRQAQSLGSASTEGVLYNLGRYPGLVLPVAAGEIVHGELLELTSPSLTLRWLDAYEGIVPGEHPHNDYERLQRPVMTSAGAVVTAWVYVFRVSTASAAPIPGGNWLATREI